MKATPYLREIAKMLKTRGISTAICGYCGREYVLPKKVVKKRGRK